MRRVVVDSNAIDPLVDRPNAYEALHDAVSRGDLEVLYTHITIDELAATGDLERRRQLLLAVVSIGRYAPTGAGAWDYSRWGHARWGDESDQAAFEGLRSNSIKHTRDALIASTAVYEKCALVTNERRLAGRARERGIEVLTMGELLAEFGFAAHP